MVRRNVEYWVQICIGLSLAWSNVIVECIAEGFESIRVEDQTVSI